VRYGDGVEERRAAAGLKCGQIAVKRQERQALRRQYEQPRLPSLAAASAKPKRCDQQVRIRQFPQV
jgi:hypothetical protein